MSLLISAIQRIRSRLGRKLVLLGITSSIALALQLTVVCLTSAQDTGRCPNPIGRDDGWRVASPESVGLDLTMLCAMAGRLDDRQEDVHSILVIRHGKLVFERYFRGFDQKTEGGAPYMISFDADTKHRLYSITKSVTSLLVGIAIGRGKIASVDTPVSALLSDYTDLRTAEKNHITLRHLLTMSAGLDWDENVRNPANSVAQMRIAADPYRFVLERRVVNSPGQIYNYSSAGATLLSAVLRQVTGQSLEAFAREALFEPLGIHDVDWFRFANGDVEPGAGLHLRPRDLARIGQLMLSKGRWNGREIVPAAWIVESTRPQINGQDLYFYGYQWWLGRSLVNQREIRWFSAYGFGDQRLFVVPDLDLVLVITSGRYDRGQPGIVPLTLLAQFVLPAVRE
jgi:CubicO group peptidase (beta-lactamase class C family)